MWHLTSFPKKLFFCKVTWSHKVWVQGSTLLLTESITSGKLFPFTSPQLSHLKIGDNSTHLSQMRLKWHRAHREAGWPGDTLLPLGAFMAVIPNLRANPRCTFSPLPARGKPRTSPWKVLVNADSADLCKVFSGNPGNQFHICLVINCFFLFFSCGST